MQIVYRFGRDAVTEVPAVAGAAPAIPTPLIFAPGTYSYNAYRYDMTAEGLYRFVHVPTPTETWADGGHRVVYASNAEALLTAISAIAVHGTADEALTQAAKTHRARAGWLSMRCGHVDQWARGIMAGLNIPCRQVSLVTLTSPNNYDDGHVCTEVKIGGVWRLFDLANDREMLADASGVAALVSSGAPYATALNTTGSRFDPLWYNANSVYMSLIYDRPGAVDQWTARIFQAVGIWHTDGKCYFKLPAGTEHRKAWLLSLSTVYRVIDDHAQWQAMFYPA